MQYLFLLIVLMQTAVGCSQQPSADSPGKKNNPVGGSCEGCEAIYESPVPFEQLSSLCWLPDWNETGTRLAVNGVVYNPDGSPAPGVVIYIYHTDQAGNYPVKSGDTGWGKRHGYLRGWMKTNEKGEYKFFTLKPASYPQGRNPAHIHVTIKEPGLNEYWIDEFLFDDDPFLTREERRNCRNRGGSGIIRTIDAGQMLKAERNIFLGKNIPGHPGR